MEAIHDISRIRAPEFFREATLELCGTLDLGRVAASLRAVLRTQGLPVDAVFVQLFEPGLGSMRLVAMASDTQARVVDLLTPIPEAIREGLRAAGTPTAALYGFDRIADDPVGRLMAGNLDLPPSSSGLLLPIVLSETNFGSVVLIARDASFTEHHAALLACIRDPLVIAVANALQHRELGRLRARLRSDNTYLQSRLRHAVGDTVIGAEGGLRAVMVLLGHVAPQDTTVVLLGETGVGKDLLAHTIHDMSPRRDGPFVPVNCGALPAGVIDSELFGHERGAYTGAVKMRRGLFERANKGTLFLDEVGELPLDAQVRLLRVIEDRKLVRVGGATDVDLDVRIIVATHRDLDEQVRAGEFREDLWFRLNVFPVRVPALRERRTDIPAFVDHIIAEQARRLRMRVVPRLARGEIDRLMSWPWPGNVRELQNVLERALILHGEGQLRIPDMLSSGEDASHPSKDTGTAGPAPSEWRLADATRRHLRLALQECRGKISGPGGAAELLDLNPSTLRSKLEKLGVSASPPASQAG